MKQYNLLLITFFVIAILLITCVSCRTEKYEDSNKTIARFWRGKPHEGGPNDYRDVPYRLINNRITISDLNTSDKADDFTPKSVELSPGMYIRIFYNNMNETQISYNSIVDLQGYWADETNKPPTSTIKNFIISEIDNKKSSNRLEVSPLLTCNSSGFQDCQQFTRGYASPEDTLYEGPETQDDCVKKCAPNADCKSIFWGISPSGEGYCYHFRQIYGDGSVWRDRKDDTRIDSMTANKQFQ